MSSTFNREALTFWKDVLLDVLDNDATDLSTRQMTIMLTVYMEVPPHTVKSLSAQLKISKAATSRALDTISIHGFIKRKRDEKDRRIVHVQRTVKGSVFLSEFSYAITRAIKSARQKMA